MQIIISLLLIQLTVSLSSYFQLLLNFIKINWKIILWLSRERMKPHLGRDWPQTIINCVVLFPNPMNYDSFDSLPMASP